MTINTLLEAAPPFDFKGENKIKLVNRNFEQAKRILRTTNKDEIERLKTIGSSLSKTERGEDLLTAINILAKISHRMGSGYGKEKINAANEILGKLETGFPDNKKEIRTNPFYNESRKAFLDKYNRQNPGAETKKEIVKPAEKIAEKPSVSEPKPVPKEEEPNDVAPPEREEEYEKPSTNVPDSIGELQDLKAQTANKIQERLDVIEKDKSIGGKIRYSNTEKVLKSYQKSMDKFIERAKAGPKSAGAAFNKANSASRIANNDAIKAGLKGAVGRTIQKGGEIGTALKQAAQKGTAKIGKALDSEQMGKYTSAIKGVKEKIGHATEKGLEKAGQKIEKRGEIADYEKIKKYIGAKDAEDFSNKLEKNEIKAANDILKKANEKQSQQIKAKTSKGIAKAKETARKVVGAAKELGSEYKTGAEMAADATKKAAKKGIESVKKIVPEKKFIPPKEGIRTQPPKDEDEEKKNRIKELAAKAKKRIKHVRGVRRIS